MNTTVSTSCVAEIPAYAVLQRQMHNALIAQHPEWILPNGDCPTCDFYDERFAEVLTGLLLIERGHAQRKLWSALAPAYSPAVVTHSH